MGDSTAGILLALARIVIWRHFATGGCRRGSDVLNQQYAAPRRRRIMNRRKVLLIVSLVLWTFLTNVGFALGSTKEVARTASSAVVSLVAYDSEGKRAAAGSGFIIRGDGLVVSNYHVVRGAHHVEVRLASGDSYDALGVV